MNDLMMRVGHGRAPAMTAIFQRTQPSLIAAAALAVLAFGASGQIVIRSGQTSSGPGAWPAQDANVTVLQVAAAQSTGLATLAFAPASTGVAADLVTPLAAPAPVWGTTLPSDPMARWINHDAETSRGFGQQARSVLYACEFNVTQPCVGPASIDLWWMVDDLLGDPVGKGSNPIGVYINGYALNTEFSGGGLKVESHASQVLPSGLLAPGINTLYVYQRDTNGITSGVIFSASITTQAAANTTLLAGDNDNFVAGGPAATMRPTFANFLNNRPNQLAQGGVSKSFDNPTPNWEFGHTFQGLPNMATATLSLRVQSTGSANDAINLQFSGNTTSWSWGWSSLLTALNGGNPLPNGAVLNLNLNLAALPGGVNLLPTLNTDGYLDVHIQDDTTVDFLQLTFCARGSVGRSTVPAIGSCPTCPDAAAFTFGGSPTLGNANFGVRMTGVPTGGLGAALLNIGSCTSGAPWGQGSLYPSLSPSLVVLSGLPISGTSTCDGASTLGLPVPSDPQFRGLSLCVQAAIICPALSGVGVTNGVQYTIQ